jgi:hypothetical protein
MARVKFGSLVSGLSGSIGGSTFQQSLYGNILRSRPRNNKTNSAAQFKARTYMTQCQAGWKALTPADRVQWDQFIAFSGASINRDRAVLLSGHALYLKYNYARLASGFTLLNSLVYASAPAWPSLNSIRTSAPNIFFYFSANLDTMQIFPTVFLSNRQSEGRSYSPAGLRFMPGMNTSGTVSYISGSYSPIFGRDLAVGDFVNVKIQFFSTISPLLSSIQTAVIQTIAT